MYGHCHGIVSLFTELLQTERKSEENMKVGVYIRVSTDKQAEEGYSLAAQQRQLTAYAESQGWEIADFYMDDGYSAKDMNRPQLKRLIKDIERGTVELVLVYKLDRLTRSVLDLSNLLELFEKYKCKFDSATEDYNTRSSSGRLFLNIIATLAQFERERLAERVQFGMAEKVRGGEWHGGTAPYGYDYKDGELVINENEAKYVRWIFGWYVGGLSVRKIVLRLNDMGITTKSGSIWREIRVRYILQNPIYIGTLRWGVWTNQENGFMVEDAAPPIIDKQTFDEAKKIQNARTQHHPRRQNSPYIFSGALRCARCAAGFKGHKRSKNGQTYYSYQCINRTDSGICDLPMISERILEHAFIQHFEKLPEPSRKSETPKTNDHEDEVKEIQKELENLKKRRKKWQYMFANDFISQDDLLSRLKEEQNLQSQLVSRLEELNEEVEEELDPEQVHIVSRYIRENWEELTRAEKKLFIQNTIEKIVVERVDAKIRTQRVRILEIVYR